jgi:PhzF family phenazine biosynthesis protein
MKFPIYQVDAFTDHVFGGNPAAVVILHDWLADATLQGIAAENNLAETAFVIPRGDEVPLRWFTPEVEMDLCGHATLATGHVLFHYFRPEAHSVTFSTRSGALRVLRDGELLSLDFPARPGRPVPVSAEVSAALGAAPIETFLARDLLAIFENETQVRNLKPDFVRMAALDAFGVIVSAPGDTVDFVSRFFAPRAGIPEDPVTGSAHCTLVPYWAERLGKKNLIAKQVSPRGGDLVCDLKGDRVYMSGRAVEYLKGEISI